MEEKTKVLVSQAVIDAANCWVRLESYGEAGDIARAFDAECDLVSNYLPKLNEQDGLFYRQFVGWLRDTKMWLSDLTVEELADVYANKYNIELVGEEKVAQEISDMSDEEFRSNTESFASSFQGKKEKIKEGGDLLQELGNSEDEKQLTITELKAQRDSLLETIEIINQKIQGRISAQEATLSDYFIAGAINQTFIQLKIKTKNGNEQQQE
jgi:hypothetical protein